MVYLSSYSNWPQPSAILPDSKRCTSFDNLLNTAPKEHWCPFDFQSFSKNQSNECFWKYYHLQTGHDTKKKNLSMLATLKAKEWMQGKRKLFNIRYVSLLHSRGIRYFASCRNDLTDKLVHVFISLSWSSADSSEIWPGLRDTTICNQVWFMTGFSILLIWEINTSCRRAVGGSLRMSGRGKVFPLADKDYTQFRCSFQIQEKKNVVILAQRVLCVAKTMLWAPLCQWQSDLAKWVLAI